MTSYASIKGNFVARWTPFDPYRGDLFTAELDSFLKSLFDKIEADAAERTGLVIHRPNDDIDRFYCALQQARQQLKV